MSEETASIEVIEIIAKIARDIPDIKKLINANLKNDNSEINFENEKEVITFLKENPHIVNNVAKYCGENTEAFVEVLKQCRRIDSNNIVIQKTSSLGKQILAGTAGAVVGGIIGNLMGSNMGAIGTGLTVAGPTIGFVVAGIAALLAVAVVGFAIYKSRNNIKGGVDDAGKKVKHLLKNVIDKLSPYPSHAVDYLAALEAKHVQKDLFGKLGGQGEFNNYLLTDGGAFVKQYLLNEEGYKALKSVLKEGEITLQGDKKLTLKDLERLKRKGNSVFKRDREAFEEELEKFAQIMSEEGKSTRSEIESKQDKMYAQSKKKVGPAPISILYSGSIANNEFLAKIDEGIRKDVKALLEKVAGFDEKLRGQFYKAAEEDLEVEGLSYLETANYAGLSNALKGVQENIDNLHNEADNLQAKQNEEKSLTGRAGSILNNVLSFRPFSKEQSL
ncbi:MAG: GlsB/YeaQ/YmgE family stress response membrane protein [Wolbachia endosymbiont of Tyrophagus putrescentiae]|nr:GlsB/YeaQ/YmgE family stress response membrane protein [Wolbachia endosymbiont of Tyrophagus putrescentiae]